MAQLRISHNVPDGEEMKTTFSDVCYIVFAFQPFSKYFHVRICGSITETSGSYFQHTTQVLGSVPTGLKHFVTHCDLALR